MQRDGLWIQIIWKTLAGGNHYDHAFTSGYEEALSDSVRLWVPPEQR